MGQLPIVQLDCCIRKLRRLHEAGDINFSGSSGLRTSAQLGHGGFDLGVQTLELALQWFQVCRLGHPALASLADNLGA